MHPFQLVATAAFGLESVLARELQSLGIQDVTTHNGYVLFRGGLKEIAAANLWLRTADRVLIVAGQFRATTFDELFEGVKALSWAEWLPQDAAFPVDGRSVDSQLASVPACQSIVKKAIVESLKQTYALQLFPETGARFNVEVALHKDEAMITIDTSGDALHKRGYRTLNYAAPLRETLAAGLILLSRWAPHRPFADPMCGSGTIAIEAAMIGLHMAPGSRRQFACEDWPWFDPQVFEDARDEAAESIQLDVPVEVFASDIDPEAVSMSKYHAKRAGVSDCVECKTVDVQAWSPSGSYGCLVSNPPYGDRMGELREVEALYRGLGRVAKSAPSWSTFIITSHRQLERLYGRAADKKRKLYNGRIQTTFYQFLGPLPPR